MDENQNNDGHMDAPHAPPEMQDAPAAPAGETPPAQPTAAPVQEAAPAPAENKNSFGPIFGIIIIVILLVLAGFYFWGSSLSDDYAVEGDEVGEILDVSTDPLQAPGGLPTDTPPPADPSPAADAAATDEVAAPVSESDDIETLEAELDDTLLDEIDAELEAIDEELTF